MRTIKPKWISGDPWKYCDICGMKYRQSETRKQWNGLIACEKCYDPKPVQLTPPTLNESTGVKDARPLGEPVFHSPVSPSDL